MYRRVGLLTWVFALMVSTSLGAQEQDPQRDVSFDAAPDVREGLGFAGLPLINFSSDTGTGYGARLVLYDYGDNLRPYRYSLYGQFFQTTGDVMSHELGFDAPRLFGSHWRVSASAFLNADKYYPYYGIGNLVDHRPEYTTCADREALAVDPNSCPSNQHFLGLRYHSINLKMPNARMTARYDLGDAWSIFGTYRFMQVMIETHYREDLAQTTDSKILEDLAQGKAIHGLVLDDAGNARDTRNGMVQAGVAYDTRDSEALPSSGVFHDVSGRVASASLGGSTTYWGGNITLRMYQHVDSGRRIVVAGRVSVDGCGGEVPFYELSRMGGLSGFEAVGGLNSVRGLQRNRLLGKIKVVANPEVRARLLTARLFGQRFDVGGIVGYDVARVWEGWQSDGPWLRWHRAVAAGARIAFNENFVVRADYGFDLEDRTSALYIDFNHVF